jgi:hypothetical protein
MCTRCVVDDIFAAACRAPFEVAELRDVSWAGHATRRQVAPSSQAAEGSPSAHRARGAEQCPGAYARQRILGLRPRPCEPALDAWAEHVVAAVEGRVRADNVVTLMRAG